jgi:hypothetical protein
MKSAQQRIRLIGLILTILGAIAWVNSIASFVVTSSLSINAEMVLLFAGMALLRPNTYKAVHVLAIVFLAGIVVLLIPITAFTISPRVNVSIFGESYDPTSTFAILFIITITAAYVATIGWLFALLRKDLRYESATDK